MAFIVVIFHESSGELLQSGGDANGKRGPSQEACDVGLSCAEGSNVGHLSEVVVCQLSPF